MDVYRDIHHNIDLILNGIMIVIDPSSGSKKSKTGYAVYDCGVCMDSGIIEIDHRKHVSERLQDTYDFLTANYCQPDLLVIERIRGSMAHVYLHWAVGVIQTAVRAGTVIELNTGMWKNKARPEYIKGDREDALEMGYVVTKIASEYQYEQK